MDNKKQLNPEQIKAIQHKTGPLLIIAGAGTGKTTVITERIKFLIENKLANPAEILALTFTEKAAREMEERVDTAMPLGYTQMWISTFHSFCDRILRREALHIGLDPRYKLMTEAEAIQLIRSNLFKFELNYFRPLGNPNKFIGGMLQHFSRLQDEDISLQDYIKWTKKAGLDQHRELAGAYKTYTELKIKNGLFDFGDLIIQTLNLFRQRKNILAQYQKQFKYILVDEFQDTNFAQNELVKLLAGEKENITVCGDDDQCLPPNSKIQTPNGDQNIKEIKIGDEVITAVGKGHTSVSKVVNVFKQTKNRKLVTLKTESGNIIVITNNHKMFCFVPASDSTKEWHYVYVMHKKGVGWRVGVTNSLPHRLKLERGGDLIIGIGSYKTDQEARFYESYYSAKYGLPTVPFSARPGQAISGNLLTRLFKEIDTERNIINLANDLKIELDSPQFLVGGVIRGSTRRIKINFEMCARSYRSKGHKNGFVANPSITHLVSLETSDKEVILKLKNAGISLTLGRNDGMRLRKGFSDIKEAWDYADKLQKITGGIIDKRFKVGRYNYQHLPARIVPASHVFPGMYLPVIKGKQIVYEKVIFREESEKEIETYDLEIAKTHNFIADGIVVHNSVYRFRGAAVSNIIQFRKSFPKLKIVVLTKNYRSTQEILDRSYDLIQHNNPDRLEVVEKVDKKLVSQVSKGGDEITFIHTDRVENEASLVVDKIAQLVKDNNYEYRDFAILVRANNHSEPFGRALLRKGIPYQFLGPGRLFKQPEVIDLISYLKVLYNFEDSVAFYRLLSIDYFDISGRHLAELGNYARKNNVSLFAAAEKIGDEKVKTIIGLINKHLELVKKESAGQILYYFLQDSGLITKLVNPDTPDAQKRAANISKFFDKLKTYEVEHEESRIPAVVDWLELSAELGESPLAADTDWTGVNAVNILTVHSAKGLEFPVVFLVNLVSQRFPSTERHEQIPIPDELIKEILPKGDFHLEEERRLFYVGMTRAKDKLFLTAANYYGEGKRDKKLSPFIGEALRNLETKNEKEIVESKQISFLDYSANQLPNTEYQPPLHITYLSYSQIETFRVCPLHYKLRNILKIPTAPSAALSFGTSMHAVMRDFYCKVGEGVKPSERLLLDLLKANWVKEGFKDKTHEKKYFEKGIKYLSEYFQKSFNKNTTPILVEESFMVPLAPSLKIGGRIDRVDQLSGGRIELIDYKTGEKPPTQKEMDKDKDISRQLAFYALAATTIPTKPFNKKAEDIVLSFYFFENQTKISTVRTAGELEKAKEEILAIRNEIEKSDFKCSGSPLCKICEYKFLCNVEG